MESINNVMEDTDIEIRRLENGEKITFNRKKKDIRNKFFQQECKDKLPQGLYSPIQYLKAIGHSMDRWVDNIETREITETDVGNRTEDIGDYVEAIERVPIDENIPGELKCVICWQRSEATALYLP